MDIHNHNLNIHYTAPKSVWEKINQLYTEMPEWKGFCSGIPYWYGMDNDEKTICASVEPSGLFFYAELPREEWVQWFSLFKMKASELLDYEIGEPEDGFEFRYYG